MKRIICILIGLSWSLILMAQGANDLCTSAGFLGVSPANSTSTFTFIRTISSSNTNSMESPSPMCGSWNNNPDNWMKLSVPPSGNLLITPSENIGSFNPLSEVALAVYSGGCGLLTELECSFDPSIGFTPITLMDLSPSSDIFIRAWSPTNNNGQFRINAKELPSSSNDLCSTATPLPVDPAACVTPTQTLDNTNFTDSGETPVPMCADFQGFDMWYSVTVPPSGDLVVETSADGTGTITDTGIAAYSGACGSLSLISCNDQGGAGDFSQLTFTGQTPGDVLLIRAWAFEGLQFGTFNICAYEPPPANDICSGALNLMVGDTLTADNTSTTDSQVAAPSCGTYNGFDLWYEVTVPANGNLVVEATATMSSPIVDLELAAYSGSCGMLAELLCVACETGIFPISSTPPTTVLNLTSLIPGDTILIRAWEAGGNTFGNFNITATDPTPANDLCTGAIQLTVDNTSCGTGLQSVDNTYATDSGEIITTDCANYQGFDLWYEVTIPASGNIIIETSDDMTGNITDTGITAYSGSCGSLTEIECDDIDGAGRFSQLDLNGQTAGASVYIRVWANGGIEFGTFNICAWEPAPINDLCSNAIALTLGSTSCGAPVQSLNNTSSTNSGELPAPSCANFQGYDIWYSFTVPASGNILIETSADGTGTITDTGISAYAGSCGSLSEVLCDNDNGLARFSRLDLQGQTPGDVILVRLWAFGGAEFGTFNICAYDQGVICPPEFTTANGNRLTVTQSVNADFETDGLLQSDQLINSNAVVDYDSKTQIDLLPGFTVLTGVTFNAFIDGCGGNMITEDQDIKDQ